MVERKRCISVQSGLLRPDFESVRSSSKNFKSLLRYAMYYVHYELSDKKLKTETIKYAKKMKLDFRALTSLENYYFSVIGKPAYLLNKKADLSEEWNEYLGRELPLLIELAIQQHKDKEAEAEKKEKVVVNIQDRIRAQAADACAIFDEWIDDFICDPGKFDPKKCDPYKVMVSAKLKAGHARFVIEFFGDDLNEVKEALAGKDEALNEGYSTYTKVQLRKIIALYRNITDSANMIIESNKAERKPRKQKVVSQDKLVEKLKYAKNFKGYGLVSINPIKIIGAKELWVYNVKTRKIGKFIATDETGLSVKGTAIQNFSPKSIEKTLRKPVEQLTTFKQCTKPRLRRFLAQINTVETKLKPRLNEFCILLQVVV